MKKIILGALFVGLLAAPAPAFALLDIFVDLEAQRLRFTKPSGESVVWKISSGRDGYETPTGKFNVQRLDADHFSDEYDGAPMPYAIFFYRGLAIHGTTERGLGRPASHGCVRLSVPHAQELYALVEKYGATVEISGEASDVRLTRDYSEAPRRRKRARRPEADPGFDEEMRRFSVW